MAAPGVSGSASEVDIELGEQGPSRAAWRRVLASIGAIAAGGAWFAGVPHAGPAGWDRAALVLLAAGLTVVAAAALFAAVLERHMAAAASRRRAFQPTSIQGQPSAASATTMSSSEHPSAPASA